jgi:hypothetical protein
VNYHGEPVTTDMAVQTNNQENDYSLKAPISLYLTWQAQGLRDGDAVG